LGKKYKGRCCQNFSSSGRTVCSYFEDILTIYEPSDRLAMLIDVLEMFLMLESSLFSCVEMDSRNVVNLARTRNSRLTFMLVHQEFSCVVERFLFLFELGELSFPL